MSFRSYLQAVNKSYQGPMLSILATGGGVSVAELMTIPGSSRIVRGVYLPYATEETRYFISENWYPGAADQFAQKAVSKESSEALFRALENRTARVYNDGSCRCLAITAALQTNRYRKGDNHAFISFLNDTANEVETWHLTLPKMSEQLLTPDWTAPEYALEVADAFRYEGDTRVARTALALVTKVSDTSLQDYPKEMIGNGSLVRV